MLRDLTAIVMHNSKAAPSMCSHQEAGLCHGLGQVDKDRGHAEHELPACGEQLNWSGTLWPAADEKATPQSLEQQHMHSRKSMTKEHS